MPFGHWTGIREREGEASFTEMTKTDIQSVLNRKPDGHATPKDLPYLLVTSLVPKGEA